jgi:D-amino-acid dehydrogenase
MREQTRDVTLIGAGMIGLCCALSLQVKGYRVHILDRVAPAESCSFGNAGILVRSGCMPLSAPGLWRSIPAWLADPDGPMAVSWRHIPGLIPWMAKFLRAGQPKNIDAQAKAMLAVNSDCVELYRQLLSGRGHEQLIRDSSYVFIYRTPGEIDLQDWSWRTKINNGVEVAVLNRSELEALEPEISPSFQAAVQVLDQGKTVNPGRLGKTLAEKVLDQGGRISRCQVRQLRSKADGSVQVTTDSGEIHAQQLVISAGSWSGELARQLGCHIPLEADRGYHLVFENPGVMLNNPVSVSERLFALSSMEMGLRCAGTSEFGGLHSPPNYNRAQMLGKLAKEVLPGLNIDSKTSEWMGHRPSVPDTVPVISRLPGYEHVYIACGHGHLGLTGAPMTGRIMASLISREPLNIDTQPYRANRF